MLTFREADMTINPFYSRRIPASVPRVVPPRYAKLPLAPVNRSPVPRLTSLYHFDRAGEYGDRGYPGNCGGNLIRDLLLYFRPRSVFDPLCAAQHNGSSVASRIMWRETELCPSGLTPAVFFAT